MDISLTASDASRLAQEALNLKHPSTQHGSNKTETHQSWFIDNGYVIRFAIYEDASKRLHREIRVRDLVGVSSSVLMPRSVATGRWGPNQHSLFHLG